MSSQPKDHADILDVLDGIDKLPDPSCVLIPDLIDAFITRVGNIICWTNALLILVIIIQVVLRYGFNNGLIFFEELQWHLFAIGVMMGISYAQVTDSHIRVDIIHGLLSDRTKRIIEIFGILFFVLPFIWVVFYHSLDFVFSSWRLGEQSDAPNGLPFRWAIKAIIPISFAFLGLSSLSRLIRDGYLLFTLKREG